MRLKPIIIVLLFLSVHSFSQTNTSAKKSLFFEKVYLHLDRQYYFAGEDIWFKAYLLNAQGAQLMPTSNNLYVELISPDNKVYERRIVRLENGLGKGDFKLGDSLETGTYRIRAYTNWMRNFGDNFVFNKNIQVTGLVTGQMASAVQTKVVSTAGSISLKKEQGLIRFFPEGGSMIEGVKAIVGVKAEDNLAKGVKLKAEILADNGEVVSRFETDENGFGSFVFTPTASSYTVKPLDVAAPFQAKLPTALPNGFSMYVSKNDTSKINVVVSTNEQTLADYKGRELDIRLRRTGIPYFTQKVAINSVQTLVTIPTKEIPEGLAAISMTDDKGRPHAERLVFISSSKPSASLAVTAAKPVYQAKQQVEIKLKAVDGSSRPAKANLSLAVVDNALIPNGKGNILSYLMLESEIKGEIEKPEQYFDVKNPVRAKKLDLLLLTQGWRDFVWKRLRDTTLRISYLNEMGFTLSGNVTEKGGDKPLSGGRVTLFANGARGQKLFSAITNPEGKFFFDNINLLGNQRVRLVSTDAKGKRTGTLNFDLSNADTIAVKQGTSIILEPSLLASLKNEGVKRMEASKRFSLSDTIQLKEVAITSSKIARFNGEVFTTFGYPDQSFRISEQDQKDYVNLRHFLITKVDGATQDTSTTSNGVLFSAQGKYIKPNFIVDRREDVFDRMDYYELSMQHVQNIIVRHMIRTGGSGFDSVSGRFESSRDAFLIYLTLKETAFSRKEPSLLNVNVNGYYQERTFFAPQYPVGRPNSKPDMRTTIHWAPNVVTDANGEATIKFFNADPKTKIRVVAEGVTERGQPLVGETSYEVK